MKKFIVISIALIFLLSIVTVVNAESFSFIVSPNKTTLKPGDEFELTLKIANIDVGENGINAIEAKLQYDENIFEKVTQENITSLNNWSLTYNGEETTNKGKMLAMKLSAGEKTNQEIGKIKLKVRENLTNTTSTKQTNITVVNIATNNGTSLVNETDKEIPLTITFDKVSSGDTSSTNTNNSSSNNSNNNNNSTVNNSSNENKQSSVSDLVKNGDNTTATGNVPQTGINEIVCVSTLIIPTILGIAGYIGYKRISIS